MNIGSGGRPLEGYVNVDAEPSTEPDVICNIGRDPWPFDDGVVDEIVAEHILEHLTTPEFFHCMRETYRVCKNGAEVKILVPHPRHDIYLGDPTHQRPVMPGTLLMFSKGQMEKLRAQGIILTPFWKILNVDFRLDTRIRYKFDAGVDSNAPDIAWQMKHLNNIVQEIGMTLWAVK